MLQQGSPQAAEGLKTASRALDELRALADQPSASPFVLDQACTSFLAVEDTSLRAPSTLLSYALRNVKNVPGNVTYQLTLAWAYRAASQPEKARITARHALSLLPANLPGESETRTHRWLTIEAENKVEISQRQDVPDGLQTTSKLGFSVGRGEVSATAG